MNLEIMNKSEETDCFKVATEAPRTNIWKFSYKYGVFLVH